MKPKTASLSHQADGGTFPFHYGNEAEQYTFYRIPKLLFDDPYFRELSTDAKILYGLMLDRMSLSLKNGWLDDEEVYAYAETYYMTSEEEFERRAAEKAEAEKKEREAVAKKRKEQEEKRKKASKDKKKKLAAEEKAVTEKAKAEAEEKGISISEPKAETAPKADEKDAPAMQEQLCLEL